MKKIICFFVLSIVSLSACSHNVSDKLNKLVSNDNYLFAFKDVKNNIYIKKDNCIYNLVDYYDDYFSSGHTSFQDAFLLKDFKFYNLLINSSDEGLKYLISAFNLETFQIEKIYEFNQTNLYDLCPELNKHKNCVINSKPGYHEKDILDFTLSFYKYSSDDLIYELSLQFEFDTYDVKYVGESYPNTYNPDEEILKKSGAIIKIDTSKRQYLEIDSEPLIFDKSYFEENCEYYEYIKDNIYKDIDSYPYQLLRQDDNFYLKIGTLSNHDHDISFQDNSSSKGIVYKIDLQTKKSSYCGFIEEDSYLIGISNS